ncbi:MAG TPA: ATP-binding protein [Acidimicrobiales bacterium]|jgi:anti-sigma regulatory factor (Ser/Thr protein kinase)
MEASIRLSPHPTSARAAREFVARTLLEWGRQDQTEAAVLLTSELVTNAIIHARTEVAVTMRAAGDGLRVVVLDESDEQPSPRSEADELGGGRGLKLVDAVAASWGVAPQGRGKAVWFELG